MNPDDMTVSDADASPATADAFNPRLEGGNREPDQLHYRPFLSLSRELIGHVVRSGILSETVTLIDCGVARGFDPDFEAFGECLSVIGVDPDASEVAALENLYPEMFANGRLHLLPHALWSSSGKRTLYITKDPDSTSLLAPNLDFVRDLPDPEGMAVAREVEIEVTALDDLRLPLDSIDVMKLDIQAAELEALRGAEALLRRDVSAIVAEVNFMQTYRDQALFSDIHLYLREFGFEVYDLDMRRWRRRPLEPRFDELRVGQIIYADALFMRPPRGFLELIAERPNARDKAIKHACLFEFFALPDCAEEVIDRAGQAGILDAAEVEAFTALLKQNTIAGFFDRKVKPVSASRVF
jgi:FkbM family methyltransferase